MLCGERGGLPPAGFDCGNSPVEIEQLAQASLTAVLTTTNGTLALRTAWECRAAPEGPVFTAALVNARAVFGAVMASRRDAAILCAGERAGTAPADEDTYTAGYLAHLAGRNGVVLSADAASAAAMVGHTPNPAEALRGSRHAVELVDLGLAADVEWCARADVLDIVPILLPDEAGIPRLVALR